MEALSKWGREGRRAGVGGGDSIHLGRILLPVPAVVAGKQVLAIVRKPPCLATGFVEG